MSQKARRSIADRVDSFHRAIESETDIDYHTTRASHYHRGNLPCDDSAVAEVLAERNRLFWAAFLNEESGEVASALVSGETPDDFEEEVADVVIVAYGIADAFGFDLEEAVHEKMDENMEKPKSADNEGTGKLTADGRGEWREEQ
jgi:NTP pyrophosphatase (non-canonical NTP hydrolase)